jgi:uncharacterized membrane protein
MFNNVFNRKLSSIIVISLLVVASIILILPVSPMTQNVKGASVWKITTDTDFSNGTLDNLTISGAGSNAELIANPTMKWIKKPPKSVVDKRNQHSMASFYGTESTVLFGGATASMVYLNDTWIYDLNVSQWIEKFPSLSPSPRRGSPMTAIYGTDKVMIFGGYYWESSIAYRYNDTWIYDLSDNNWVSKTPSNAPSKRSFHGLASIYGTDKVILFSGGSVTFSNETWIYDLSDNSWTNISSSVNEPPARSQHTITSIHGTDKIVLFGGWNAGHYNDTWIYDLSDNKWTEKKPKYSPKARSAHGMTGINNDDKLVIFSGSIQGADNNYTWIYDLSDNNWTKLNLVNAPNYRIAHTMSTTVKNQILLFGGLGGASYNETWIFKYFNQGVFTSPAKDTASNSLFNKISWNTTLQIGTDIKFQLRTANNESNLYLQNFTGPEGNSTKYYLTSGESIWTGHNNDRWLQVRVYFPVTNLINLSSLEDLTITYNNIASTILVSPSDQSIITNNQPKFKWNFIDPDSTQQTAFQLVIDDNIGFSSINYNSGINSSTISHWQFPLGTGYATIADGTWYWKACTKDDDGYWGPYSGKNKLIVDTKPPLNFIPVANPSSWTSNTQPTITFSTTDETSGIDRYEVKIDGGSFITQTSPYTLPSQSDGIHNITIRAYDVAGHFTNGYVDVYIDSVKPLDFTPIANPSGWTNDTQPVISFSTTDATSGINRYEIKIDTDPFTTKSSPYSLPPQTDGVHNITIRAYDNASNFIDGYVEVYIDTNFPDSFTPIANPSGWTNNTRPVITFSTTDATSGIDYYKIKIADGSFVTQTSPYTLPTQTEGIHNITVRALDVSGKFTDGFVNVYIDTRNPESFIPTIDPTGWTSVNEPILTFSTTDTGSGIDHYEIQIDDASFTTQTSPYSLPTQSDGMHNITVRALDVSGRITDGYVDAYIDTTPPAITHTPVISGTKGFSITITAVIFDEHSSIQDVELYFKKLTDSTYSTLMMTSEDSTYTAIIPSGSVTEDGIEYFIKTTDKTTLANINYYGYDGITILEPGPMTDIDISISAGDKTPPTITHIPVVTGNIGKKITVSATIIDDVSGVKYVELFYKMKNDNSYSNISMSKYQNSYTAEIPAQDVTVDGLEYFIKATDKATPPNIAYFGATGQVTIIPTSINDIDIEVTEKDTTPPTILDKTPVGNNVHIGTTITITFSESMDQAKTKGVFSISPEVSGSLSWNGNMLIYTLDTALKYGTTYNISIGTGAVDLSGNNLASDFIWEFTTTSVIDTESPSVDDAEPEGLNVPVDTSITITFSELMSQQTTEAAFSITPSVTGSFHWIGETLVFTPDSPLSTETQYRITISTNAKDLVGNNLGLAYSWLFTTSSIVDITPPVVIESSPKGSKAPIEATIKIIFDEPMNNVDTEAAFSISPDVNGSFNWDGNTLIYTPNIPLEYNTKYEIVITTNANDLFGNNLQNEERWSFTTVEETKDDDGMFGLGKIGGIDTFILLIIIIIIIVILLGIASRRRKEKEEDIEPVEDEVEESEDEEEETEEEDEDSDEGEEDLSDLEASEDEEPDIEEDIEDYELPSEDLPEQELEVEPEETIDLDLFDDTEPAAKPSKPSKLKKGKGIAPKKGKELGLDKISERIKKPAKPSKPKKGKGKSKGKPLIEPEAEDLDIETAVIAPIEVEREFEPEFIKLEDKSVQCGICLGVIKTGLMAIKCKCGKLYHESCGVRVGECPRCDRKFILEKLAKLKAEEIESMEEKEESELSPEEFEKQQEKKEQEKRSEVVDILSGLEKRLAKGEISEETYLMLRKKYEQ